MAAMSYVDKILIDGERVLFHARIHPIIFFPGAFMLILAVVCAKVLPTLSAEYPLVFAITNTFKNLYSDFEYLPQVLAGLLFTGGVYKLIKAYIIAAYTELVVTSLRVIAKFGVFETTTIEMEKQKIVGVVIHQNPIGQVFNYGTITLRGFAGNISGIPAIAKPYELQKYINTRHGGFY